MKSHLHTIVSPVYNSRETLPLLVETVSRVMDDAGINFELVLIDDGSADGSFGEIRRLAALHPFIRGFRLARNFGHQAALVTGLQNSRGEFVAIIDDDLQDPPHLLPTFFQRLYQDADVVYGIRRKRKETFLKRFLYASFYRILQKMSEVEIPLDAGDFCVMRRCVVEAMIQFREANPFLRGIRSWVGFRQVGLEYKREARYQGESGYTFGKYFRLAIAGIISFSYIPLRLATFFGIVTALIGFFFACFVILKWLFGAVEVSGYASLVVVITLLGGVQLICMGIIGEYLARLSDNVRKPMSAVVAETTGENSP